MNGGTVGFVAGPKTGVVAGTVTFEPDGTLGIENGGRSRFMPGGKRGVVAGYA